MVTRLQKWFFVLTLTFFTPLTWAFPWPTEYALEDVQKLQWRQLTTSNAVLSYAPVPYDWLAGAYISIDAINMMLAKQDGTTIEIRGVKDFDDLKITVGKIEFQPDPSSPKATIDLTASSAKRKVSLQLVAQAVLGFKGTEFNSSKKETVAVFQIVMTQVRTKFGWRSFSLSTPRMFSALMATGVMKGLGEKLRFPVPLSAASQLSLGERPSKNRGPTTETKTSIKTDAGGSVSIKITRNNVDIPVNLSFSTPLFTGSGVWILANDRPFIPPIIDPPSVSREAELERLLKEVSGKLDAIPKPHGDIALYINKRTFETMATMVRSLPVEDRSVYLRSSVSSGNIYEINWRDNTLGKGGLEIRGASNEFLDGMLTMNDLQTGWDPKKGLLITGSVNAKMVANLHWHFDPSISGGFGKDFKIEGEMSVPTRGVASLELVDLQGIRAVMLVPQMECVYAPVSLRSAGGKTNIGIQTGVKLFSAPLLPTALLTSQTMRVEMPEKLPPSKTQLQYVPSWASPALDLSIAPTEVQTLESGMYVEGAIQSLNTADSTLTQAAVQALKDQQQEQLADATRTYNEQLPVPQCSDPPKTIVTVAGLEIGPNNELVKIAGDGGKLLRNAWNEMDKAIKTPGDALADAPGNVAKEVKRVCKRFFGKRGCKWL